MIRMNIENTRVLTPVCRQCAGKYANIADNGLRQELVLKEFGQIGSNCPPDARGEFPCPYRKK